MNEWSVRCRATQHKTNTRGEHPRPTRNSNPRSQQSNGFRSTSYTA